MTAPHFQSITQPRPNPTRVLVLGSTGMVGRSWLELLAHEQIECVGLSRPEFDLMSPDSISRCLKNTNYDLVVNAAAWTDVDGAEANEQDANRTNADGVDEIAQYCNEINAPLITYSTDYVFAGNANTPYAIDAPINPINAYGRSKAHGEALLAASNTPHILIRTSWVYAPWGTNFVRTIQSLAQGRDELKVVDDQRGNPTSAQHLAAASLKLYLAGAQGIWHLSDENECTWFDLASEIIRYSDLNCTVNPCSSDEYPRPASRPAYSTLDLTESTNLIGPLGTWQSHLHEVLNSIMAD